MTDLASLVLAIDSTQVPKGTAALDGLAAAGQRAEQSMAGATAASRSVGAAATQMAAQAQSSARAAVGMAAGVTSVGMAANNARVVMLDMTHVGINMGQMLASGVSPMRALVMESGRLATALQYSGGSVTGLLGQFGRMIGVVKTVQNAELAAEAASAAAAAAAVKGAADRTAANVIAADTELALAEAQMRLTAGTSAATAAQVRLAEAHQAIAAAAAEAAVAEDALAVAQGRAADAAIKSRAATRTLIGGAGVGLIGIGVVAGVAFGAIKKLQDQIKDDGTLTRFRDNLGLTHKEMLQLSDGVDKAGGKIKELTDVAPTLGDVMHGLFAEIAREASANGAWDKFKSNASDAFSGVLGFWNKTSAALSAGLWTLGDIAKDVFQFIAQQIGKGFYDGVNKAIDALNSLNARIPKWAGGGDPNLIPHLKVDNSVSTLGGLGSTIRKQADANYREALAANERAFGGIRAGAIQSAEDRMRQQADALIANRTPKKERQKKPNDHGLQESLDKLQAEIKGQYDLAAAYGVSDAAAQRAVAAQRAAEDAIQHKGGLDQFKALELQKIVATDVADQAKRNASLQVETSIRARLNGQLASGTLTVSAYNDQLKLQTTLNGLNADLENADAQHKGIVRDVIKQTIDLQTEQLQLEAQLNALKQIASNDNDIERMKLENSLLGASNKERATAIAQLEAMQQLKEIDPNGLLTRGQRNDFVQSAIEKAQLSVQTPFQQWAATVPQTAAAVNEALQSIAFKGFDDIASSLTDVIMGTKSLGTTFKDVTRSIINDILQMTIKMLIFKAVSGIFGGGGGGPIGSFFGGARASGGPVSPDQTYLVGEKGPELFRPSSPGTIVPNNQLAANNNQRGPVEVIIGFGDAPAFAPYVQAVAAQAAGQAVQVSVKHTDQTIRGLQRPKLMGR